MTVPSVYPPASTPGGWYGCFGSPTEVNPHVFVARPVSGRVPCGNETVESCCIVGDRCLSNGVCQVLPVADNGAKPLYYGSYCTDPTFTSPQCTANCAMRYMAYCGSNNIWQCGDTDRTRPFACNLSDVDEYGSSTFWMLEPTKLALESNLPSTAPTTTDPRYVPTQWGVPRATRESEASASATDPLITRSSMPGGMSLEERIEIGVGIGVGVPSALVAIGTIVLFVRRWWRRRRY